MALSNGEDNVEEVDETIYVAVSKVWKACKSSLEWASRNAKGKKLCLLHVHQPADHICILGAQFPVSSLSEQEVEMHRQREKQDVCNKLDEFVRVCSKAWAQVEKLYIEKDSIESGLVELISQHKIKKLVMGAAADKRYSKKMMEPTSKKAKYVLQHAPASCHIWFTCKGHLIDTRESIRQSRINERSLSKHRYAMSKLTQINSQLSTSTSIDSEGSCDDLNLSSKFSSSLLSIGSRSSKSNSDSTVYYSATEDEEPPCRSLDPPLKPGERRHVQSTDKLEGGTTDNALYNDLEQAIAEAENAKQEAFEESLKRHRAEKDTIEAISKAKTIEILYNEELKRRKELEEALLKSVELLEHVKEERDMALEKFQVAVEQNTILKSRAEKSEIMGKELEEKLVAAWELFQRFRNL